MKVLDLLNKIANGDIPNKIIYDKHVYQWNEIKKNYERETDINTTLNWDYIALECLNEEIVILEDKIKPIFHDVDDGVYYTSTKHKDFRNYKENFIDINELFRQKINEIIDKLNEVSK